MAVLSCKKRRETEQARIETELRRQHSAMYRIETDGTPEHPYEVADQAVAIGPHKLPQVWSRHPADFYAYVRSVEVTRHPEHAGMYDARVEWRAEPNQQPPDVSGAGVDNPLLLPVEYSIEFQSRTEVAAKAYYQTALTVPGITIGDLQTIQNAVGDQFDDPLYKEVSDMILVIKKSYSSLNTITAVHRAFDNTTNNATFFNFPKHQVGYLTPSVSEIQYAGAISYYTARWRLLLSGKPIYAEVVNRGTHCIDANGKKAACVDENGNESKDPWPLALDGTQIPPNQVGTTISMRTLEEEAYTYWTTLDTGDLPE